MMAIGCLQDRGLARFLAVGPILAYPVLEPLYTAASRRP